MISTKLGKSNLEISRVALGTVQFGLDYGFGKSKSQTEVDAMLDCASQRGINLIDTAREYGDSELKIGNYFKRHNNEFMVASKLKKISKPDLINKSIAELVDMSVQESLENLGLDRVAILQLHQTDDYVIDCEEFWQKIMQLKSEGIIEAFGVSVYEIEEAEKITKQHHARIDFFQVPFNIFDRRFSTVRDLTKEKCISIIARSVFLKGMIACNIEELPKELEGLKPLKERLSETAIKHRKSESDLALQFAYCSDHIDSFIIGVNSVEELIQNLNAVKDFKCENLSQINFDSFIVNEPFLIDPRKWKEF